MEPTSDPSVVPSNNTPAAAEMPADVVALRKSIGLPLPGDPPPEATPGDKPVEPAKAAGDKPVEQKPSESDGEFALRLAREARARSKAEKQAQDLGEKLKAAEAAGTAPKAAKDKWAAGQHVEALQEFFGELPPDLFLKLAAKGAPETKVLTEDDVQALVKARLEQQAKEAEDAQTQREKDDQSVIEKFEEAKVEEIAQLYQANANDFPALSAFPVRGERVAELYREACQANGGPAPEGVERLILEFLETEAVEKVKALPFFQQQQKSQPAQQPAPTQQPSRTFTQDDRRGATTATPPPEPKTARERWDRRKEEDEAFIRELQRKQAAGQLSY